jgi:hypothetical protein
VNLFLESFQRLAHAFADLRKLAGTKNNQHNDQNDDQF